MCAQMMPSMCHAWSIPGQCLVCARTMPCASTFRVYALTPSLRQELVCLRGDTQRELCGGGWR